MIDWQLGLPIIAIVLVCIFEIYKATRVAPSKLKIKKQLVEVRKQIKAKQKEIKRGRS